LSPLFLTILAVAVAGVYFSGYADDLFVDLAKKYYKAEAKAEAKAFEKAEGDQAKSFFKDQLKKNPVMGEGELEQVAPGLGSEAVQEGLGGVSSKLGGLGKL